jgi:hypothetical protein
MAVVHKLAWASQNWLLRVRNLELESGKQVIP